MARHRQEERPRTSRAPAPTTSSPVGAPGTVALPSQELGERHPSGPLPRLDAARPDRTHHETPRQSGGRHRSSDPDTTPLDLAAIALAAASARTTALPSSTTTPAPRTTGPTTGATPLVAPAAEPVSHRTPARGARVLLPTRAAGALALVGAIAGAGVAAAGGGTMLTAGDTPDTGEFRLPDGDPALAGLTAPDSRAVTGTSTSPTTSAPRTTAPSRSTPAPAAPGAQAPADGGRTIWSADFASAGLRHFRSTPWNNQGASGPRVSGGAVDFTMPGGGKRSELEPEFPDFQEGDEYYVGFSVRLADDFPVTTSDWQVITQFKNNGTGSPPLEVKVQDGQFVLDGGSGAFHETIGRAVPGQWTHLVLKVKFSSTDGRVSAWQDGRQTITDYKPPTGTLYDGLASYLKIGIYRNTAIDQPGRLSFGSYAIGTSLGAVDRDDRATATPAAGAD